MTDGSYRTMTDWQLSAALETNTRALAGLNDQEGVSEQKLQMMSSSLGESIRALNREVACRRAVATAKVAGAIFGALLWVGGSIAIGVYIDDAAGAVTFWIGLGILAVLGLVVRVRNMFRPKRY